MKTIERMPLHRPKRCVYAPTKYYNINVQQCIGYTIFPYSDDVAGMSIVYIHNVFCNSSLVHTKVT